MSKPAPKLIIHAATCSVPTTVCRGCDTARTEREYACRDRDLKFLFCQCCRDKGKGAMKVKR